MWSDIGDAPFNILSLGNFYLSDKFKSTHLNPYSKKFPCSCRGIFIKTYLLIFLLPHNHNREACSFCIIIHLQEVSTASKFAQVHRYYTAIA